MNRRQFTKIAGIGIATGAVGAAVGKEEPPDIIDVHQHVNFHGRRDDELITHQKKMGVSKTVLLPSASALAMASTHNGKSNGLAARVFGTQASARLAAKRPDLFAYFCNEIPDAEDAVPRLEKWLKRGACGIGESKFHLECDSAPMLRLYEVAQEFKVPVLLHFEHNRYNMGFERFHKVLAKFPEVNFIGHAQAWWGNIDAKHEPTVNYPTGPVTPGGLSDKYLSDYPNMYGDLSAGSGRNALNRDEEHAADFLDRHQDKLLLGTDCADPTPRIQACSGLDQINNVKRLLTDEVAKKKIFSENAKRIIKL
ncbi:amidohydrolase [Verrucomicrobiales bacterium]|jgi:predicted TIM-barrel fold metal-dependent hydrolase|nr:amidohydrolase [Verrucomicrobiales bacterium]